LGLWRIKVGCRAETGGGWAVQAKKTGRKEGRWGEFPAGEGEEKQVGPSCIAFYLDYQFFFSNATGYMNNS
jgi:hypothetical protein